MPLNNNVAINKISCVSWTGNNTANRSIPHGLNGIPKYIEVMDLTACNRIQITGTQLNYMETSTPSQNKSTVTAADSTNIYVGNAANYVLTANANGYSYVALVALE